MFFLRQEVYLQETRNLSFLRQLSSVADSAHFQHKQIVEEAETTYVKEQGRRSKNKKTKSERTKNERKEQSLRG